MNDTIDTSFDENDTNPEDIANPNALFPEDCSVMSLDARRAAIALKTERYITGELVSMVNDHYEEVVTSLNNDLLELHYSDTYDVMYATPVSQQEGLPRSVKKRSRLNAPMMQLLCIARDRVAECEAQRIIPEEWWISRSLIKTALTTGAGYLASRIDEAGIDAEVDSLIRSAINYGYFQSLEDDPDTYLVQRIVPAIMTLDQVRQWAAQANQPPMDTAPDISTVAPRATMNDVITDEPTTPGMEVTAVTTQYTMDDLFEEGQ
ncbi:DUF4194 domain-containing protein [Bifidobacterium gallicum]|uniref:DUF4194 domain-containing protein n=1 Tax=Bifidobacterium gallicum DSM 20093 = LMG 11596 TaxID=561180 RepID=D1NTS8_9BIFI|nr:DUF4194 domain-containing protein [Bifidobacterium gallicum]EFA23132.1 hypothetical protein BIFGAL_03245 [Bifidobacterium gallicum DSM 20093 = LMG 11596]KFI58808.1 hypothetical protein BGLCM_1102 [Bifidobacterium gallicum DSM 20093 = LMG 11596]